MTIRLDKALVERKMVSTRQRAVALIKKGKVKLNGMVCNVVAQPTSATDAIVLMEPEMKWVGRGAYKLLAAIEHWKPELKDKTAMDIGASTGGFTQVLLEMGVKRVYAVDTGMGQMAPKILNDHRVVNIEKTNARNLSDKIIPEKADVCVLDVSFISVLKVLPAVLSRMKKGGIMIALIKPQFEAGAENLDKKGIVRDQKIRENSASHVMMEMMKLELLDLSMIDSPITGGDGNKEYLVYGKYNPI